jgi:hypothetical protein
MLTDAQIAANRKSAANVVKNQLGLDVIDVTLWTFDQRVSYDKALAAYISAHPDAFGSQDLAIAADVEQKDYGQLSDPDFSFADFGNAVVDEAVAINSDINPFSEKNRKILFWLTVAGVAVYFLAPTAVKLIEAGKGKASS